MTGVALQLEVLRKGLTTPHHKKQACYENSERLLTDQAMQIIWVSGHTVGVLKNYIAH
jgi:hypothetical protein